MEHDAFTAGVAPGGLTSKQDIRLLICYLLCSVEEPLMRQHVLACVEENRLANYFEVSDAIGELTQLGHITAEARGNESCLCITKSGRQVAEALESDLPVTVRERAVRTAVRLLAYLRNERENRVEIEPAETGFYVCCHVSDGQRNLMKLSLLVADRLQAESVRSQFLKDPGRVYRGVLALQTGDVHAFDALWNQEEFD